MINSEIFESSRETRYAWTWTWKEDAEIKKSDKLIALSPISYLGQIWEVPWLTSIIIVFHPDLKMLSNNT
jgi:ABC-type iron transport system FetAB ATPase subunit